MRLRVGWLFPLLVATSACGSEFTQAPADLDASNPTREAGADQESTDGPPSTTRDGGPDVEPPAVADGLLLWVRADLGVTQSNGAVSEWLDQSGNQLHARQPDTARQPTLAEMGIGGHPTVVFNGEDFLSLPSGFADFSHGGSFFAVSVVNEMATCIDQLHLPNGP